MDRLLAVGPVAGAMQAPTDGILALVAALLIGSGAVLLWRRHGGPSTVLSAESGSDTDVVSGDGPTTAVDTTTDEDRIVALLRDNDGRMRQSDIVNRTDWSKSKVSVLLSEMDDEGQINKLRLGRENIISLPGHEPEATRSPHDE